MRFRFHTKQLQALYTSRQGAARYPSEVVAAFFRVMAIIEAAPDESEFRKFERLHYEKLRGRRGQADERSMVLHDRWRLIVRIEKDKEGKEALVIEISKHYE